ncbi:CPBP family intramembrane metalloprotease [Clostridium sp. YIM B02515]|uniref:CPBP family intramembrane metalloprotease n=1 Tax=Clostridium rhizosphaerae TaxID=2803861 RepID=A0ABS1TFE3_9CLOT|nr:CPBP family intramembrane metalloprotease [Clostridium rhizosphaerae]
MVLISSTIAIPIFEELLFRGYVWNELKQNYKSDLTFYVVNTVLFAIWHNPWFSTL